MFSLFAALFAQLRHALAERGDLLLENLALRQQLAIDQRNGRRPKLTACGAPKLHLNLKWRDI